MDKNRIGGSSDRTSELMIAKSVSIKAPGCKSGGCVGKAVKLNLGELCRVPDSGLGESQGEPIATQQSAEAVVGGVHRRRFARLTHR